MQLSTTSGIACPESFMKGKEKVNNYWFIDNKAQEMH